MCRDKNELPEITTRFAIAVIENVHHELLLLKRSGNAGIGAGLWGFPAGHIEAGEKPADCIQRELVEEIGPEHILKPVSSVGPVRDTQYGGIYEIYLYHYRWQYGTVKLNHEHTGYAWVGREDFRSYDVMGGVDEDILYLGIWPREFLHGDRLPANLAAREPPGEK